MNLFVTQTRVVEVPVKTLSLAATYQQAMLVDAAGQCVGSTASMPAFMPTLLEIDLATGQIKNWCVPTGEQLQAIADANVSPMRKALDLVESPSFFQDRIKPSLLTEQRMAELMQQSKQVEIDTFNPSEVMPDTTAVLEKYMPQMTNLVDVSDSKPLEIEGLDEPTESDTGLCPDVPDSFYAVPVTSPALVDVNKIVSYGASLSIGTLPDDEPVALEQVYVWFDAATEKWTAETKDYASQRATSTQGKFEAIKNVLKKAGLHGVYEINLVPVLGASSVKGDFYTYDGSRTLDADTVYMTQGADGAWSARMPNNRPVSAVIGIDGALTGLLKEMEGIQPEDAVIIETTDDEMRSRNKRRYAVTAKHEHAPVEASTAIPADLPSVAPTPATVEPVADPDDVVPVCTLKKTLEPLPAITDNGDLPSDFDGSDDKLDVTVATRDNGEFVATTGAGATYVRASSRTDAEAALKNLLKKCGMIVSDTAIVETTSTYDSVQLKRRFSIDTSFAQYEVLPVNADPVAQIDIEEAIAEAPESTDTVIQPAPVDVINKLDMDPYMIRRQLEYANHNQADPIYAVFFAARGLVDGGRLTSKGSRLLANLGMTDSKSSRAEQMVRNACEVAEPPATYAEIVALINHAKTQMQCLALMDRIGKHENTEERRRLFALQKERGDALKADSAA